jgi:hypothetical protein
MKVVRTTIVDSPVFWIGFVVSLCAYTVFGFVLIILSWSEVKGSVVRRRNFRNGRLFKLFGENEFTNPLFLVFHVFGAIHIIALEFFVRFPQPDRLKLLSYRPFSYNLRIGLTHYESELVDSHSANLVNNVRSFLPSGRYWLDTRDPPIFPAVHGDFSAFCAYNSNDSKCINFRRTRTPTPTPPPLQSMPNIVVLLYESLTPFTYLMSDEFIDEHASLNESSAKYFITDTPFYNGDVMPFLREFSRQSITFSGTSSLGLPTFSGWHSFMTGLTPSQTYMNIIDGTSIHSDDLASFMRHSSYRSYFLSAQTFDFDGMRNWVYRRSSREEALIRRRCVEGYGDLHGDPIQDSFVARPRLRQCNGSTEEFHLRRLEQSLEYLDMPKWFDFVSVYFPSESQAKLLNLSYDTLIAHDWIADRITQQQFRVHWQQQRCLLNRTNRSNTPIFGMLLDIESHMPYLGYDKDEFYDPINDTIRESSPEHKILRFKRVNKYADFHFLNRTIEFLRSSDPNTIVLITGDHGTRDVPIRSHRVTNRTILSGDCVGGSSGIDSFFVVSSVLGYLGSDPVVKEILGLDDLVGKTIKVGTDHHDLTYSIMDIVSRLRGHSFPPTHKRSRNLIDFSRSLESIQSREGNSGIVKIINESGWQSLSFVSYQLDYRHGSEFLRTHVSDIAGSHYYNSISFPTCLKFDNASDHLPGGIESQRLRDCMFEYLSDENYLSRTNRLFHYQFRDESCISAGHCEFPTPTSFDIDDTLFYVVIIGWIFIWFVIGNIVVSLVYLHQWIHLRDGYDDGLHLVGFR